MSKFDSNKLDVQDIFKDALDKIDKATVQILYNYKPHCSGVLVYYYERFFLFSAAHGFWDDQYGNYQFALNNGDIIGLQGMHTILEKNNFHDYSILEIDNHEIIKKIQQKNLFVDLKLCESFLISAPEPYFSSPLFLMGYPIIYTKKFPDKIAARSFSYFSKYREIRSLKKESNDFVFMDFERRKSINHNSPQVFSTAPIPKGCSGCGAWAFFSEETPILIGIFIEYMEKKSVLKSVKIEVIKKFIDNHLLRN